MLDRENPLALTINKGNTIMIYIKIPAPSFKELTHTSSWFGEHIDKVARTYVAVIDKQLESVSGKALDYDCIEVDSRGIYADINPNSLMSYSDACSTYSRIDIRGAIINRIKKINSIDDSCPVASNEDLQLGFSEWHDRWVTVYIWVLLGAKFSTDNMWWTEQMVLSELISDKELVEGLVSKIESGLSNWVA